MSNYTSKPVPNRNITPSDYHSLAKNKGIVWVGVFPKYSSENTNWKCRCGNIWATSYQSIKTGVGLCPDCINQLRADQRRIPAYKYHELANKHGMKWIGDEVPTTKSNTLWLCVCGREYETCYMIIDRGGKCPQCRTETTAKYRKVSDGKYKILAEARGFEFLGTIPTDKRSYKGIWKCPKGHIWNASYDKINIGRGCPTCANQSRNNYKRIPPEDYTKLAQMRGFKWTGSYPRSTSIKTTWECPNGHKWEATYSKISLDRGCPRCLHMVNGHMTSKPQRDICTLLDGELNRKLGRCTIDIAIERDNVHIAIEYDCSFWHDEVRDTRKDKILKESGWKIIRIKSGSLTPTREQLELAIWQILCGCDYIEIALADSDKWRGLSIHSRHRREQ